MTTTSSTPKTRRGKTFRDLVIDAKTRIKEVTAKQLKQWQAQGKDIVLIDVREPNNYTEAHIEGAVSVPRGMLELEIDELAQGNQDKTVVAYCGGGSRSALSADTLEVMGYSDVYSLAGGWRGWNQDGNTN